MLMSTQNQNVLTRFLGESAQCDFLKPVAVIQHQEEMGIKMALGMFIIACEQKKELKNSQ